MGGGIIPRRNRACQQRIGTDKQACICFPDTALLWLHSCLCGVIPTASARRREDWPRRKASCDSTADSAIEFSNVTAAQPLAGRGHSETGSSIVLRETRTASQESNENATFARPLPASSGTRTGPWNSAPQQTRSRG